MWLHVRIFCYVLIISSGGSTGLNAEGIAGRVLLILAEVVFLVVWLSLVAGCAYLCCRDCGKHLYLYLVISYLSSKWNPSISIVVSRPSEITLIVRFQLVLCQNLAYEPD